MALFTDDARPGTPYWWDGLALAAPDDPLPQRVDLLVIGAGYTGLSGAIAAAERGVSVAVLDAGDPGKGASTRNGGMFGAHPRLSWDKLRIAFGADVADALFAEAEPARLWVEFVGQRIGHKRHDTRSGRPCSVLIAARHRC